MSKTNKVDNFEAFMHPIVHNEIEIEISDRFKNKDGEIEKVRIKGLSTEEVQKIVNKSNRLNESDTQLTNRLIVACMVYPNLREKTLCDYYKVYEPEEVLTKIFDRVDEYTKLSLEVNKLLGIKTDKQLRDEAKN